MTAHHEGALGEVRTITLDRFKVQASMYLPRHVVDRMHVEVAADAISDALLAQIRYDVFGHKLPGKTVAFPVRGTFRHRVPAGPWQLFKAMHRHRWFMRWREWRVVEAPEVEVEFACDVFADVDERYTWPEAAVDLPPRMGPAYLSTYVRERRADLPTIDEVRDRRYR